MYKIIAVAFTAFVLFFPHVLAAQSKKKRPSAKELVLSVDRLFRAEKSHATLLMKIKTPHWTRSLKLKAYSSGDNKTLIEILEPLREKGIKTLRLDRSLWNYFPKIGRTIEVPPSVMTGSWMGSDFSNDDLVKQASLAEDYNLELKESPSTWIIKLKPKADLPTVWGSIEIILDKSSRLPLKQSYFDEKGEKMRQMTFTDVRSFGERRLPSKLLMETLSKEGYQTIMKYQEIDFNPQFTDQIFIPERLQSKTLR